MPALDDLLIDIFEGRDPALYPDLERWMRDSRRFRAFVETYRSKIRAKLRNARDARGMGDLRAELETAALLLTEPRFSVEYEKHAASKQRSPDFAVLFKTHTPFNVEVRRIRDLGSDDQDVNAGTSKMIAVLCDKVWQMPPSIVNLLWLTAEREISEAKLIEAVTTLRQLAEHKDEDYFRRRGFESAAVFLKQYQQLSGIRLPRSGGTVVWLNPLARHKVPPEILSALLRTGME